ncbi:potassium-transporting ATPase subunit KdpC [Paenibacillus sp. UNC451MF]|uniref:potassium-transporting ATPase subunit KdpC n=1 Tax=Paenibacillus sp. UNC451MF TaxID=1449063 RepID=UPI00048F2E39|nr:potassium-transporting ATPase subunit KdpC [Paenibacillus sp. UNC451MF]
MNKSASQSGTGTFSFFTVLRIGVVFIVLCGIVYPLVCTGLAQVLMPGNANGSLVKNASGEIVGSELIGQKFADPKWFQGRVSSIDYKAEASGTNNYAPSNPELIKRTQASIDDWKANNPDVPISKLPIDLITNSASGLDPHISPESAKAQVPRISKLTGISLDQLNKLVDAHTQERDWGLFGEPRVNVLKLNIDLETLTRK